MLFIISLSSIVTGIYRDGFAALFPFLQEDFYLTRAQIGLHSTLFFSTSMFISMFAGFLVDLKGSKWSLVFGVLLMGIFITLHSMASNFTLLIIMAALTGLAVSINLPAASKGIIEWFPQKWRSTALGIRSMAFPIGGLLGSIFLPFLGGVFGWRKTIIFPGMLAILCAIFILYFYPNKNEEDSIKKNNPNSISFWKSFNQLFKNSDLISFATFGFFLAATSASIATHFTLFLYLDYGFSVKIAGLGFAFVQLGSILGRPVWGLICERSLGGDKRKTFLYMGLLFTTLSLFLGLFIKNFNPPVSVLLVIAFLIGFSGRGWNGIYHASIAETVKEKEVGMAMGFSALLMRPGMVLAPPIFGYIADLRNSYDLSWLLLGLMLFLASVGQYLFSYKRTR